MTLHDLLRSWIEDYGRQFADRTGLSGVLDTTRVPARYRVVPKADLLRIANRGRAALRHVCELTGVASREDVAVRLAVLAVAPQLACAVAPGAPGPDPRVVADVRTFATAILGYAPGARLELRERLVALFPPGWRVVLDALARARRTRATEWKQLRGAANPTNAGLALALLAVAHRGLDVSDLAPDAPLVEWAGAIGWRGRRVEDWKRGLREIVALSRTPAACSNADVCPELANLGVRLAVNPFIVPRAAARGLAGIDESGDAADVGDASSPGASPIVVGNLEPPSEFTAGQRAMLQRLRVRAPRFYEFVLCPRVKPDGETEPLRPATVRHLLECVDHLLAAYLQLRPLLAVFGVPVHKLRELTPSALLHLRVPAWLLAVAPPVVQHRPGVLASLAQSDYEKTDVEHTVPFLQLLIDRQVKASRAHSPVSVRGESDGAVVEDAPLRYTKALASAARTFQHGFDRWVLTTTHPATDERAHLERLAGAARQVARDVAAGVAKGQRFKRPERLLGLITLPQLVCVGLPRLTGRLLAAYRAYCAAGRAHELPRQFTQMLESCVTTAVFVADTLREKNLRHARMNHEIRVSWAGAGDDAMITGVHSTFTGFGGDNPPAALKIKREYTVDASGRRRRRERVRTHRWPPAVVKPRLLELYLKVIWREAQPPNVSPPGTPFLMSAERPGQRLSRKQIGTRVARVLHWICREVLGRELEPWNTFRLTSGQDFYGLFGPHVLRALQATYWVGVRERGTVGETLGAAVRHRLRSVAGPGFVALGMDTAVYATRLLNDTKTSLENDYNFLTPEAAARRCTSSDTLTRAQRWEHERAYDHQMDLVALGVDVAWHRQVGMPLPPGLRLHDLSPDGAE